MQENITIYISYEKEPLNSNFTYVGILIKVKLEQLENTNRKSIVTVTVTVTYVGMMIEVSCWQV